METKSPWNEYGEAKILELEYELNRLSTIVQNQQTAIDKMTAILGDFVKMFGNLLGTSVENLLGTSAEGDDRK